MPLMATKHEEEFLRQRHSTSTKHVLNGAIYYQKKGLLPHPKCPHPCYTHTKVNAYPQLTIEAAVPKILDTGENSLEMVSAKIIKYVQGCKLKMIDIYVY